MCEDNCSVNFVKLIKYREKMQRSNLKIQGKNRGFHILKLN